MLRAVGLNVYRHRVAVVLLWMAAFAAAAPFALSAGDHLKPGGFSTDRVPSAEARRVLEDRFGLAPVSLELIFSSSELNVYDPAFTRHVQEALRPLEGHARVLSVRTHHDDPARVSKDGRAVHVSLGLAATLEESVELLREIEGAIQPGPLRLELTGAPPLYRDINLTSASDLRRAETLALPLATIALLLVFGTLVAAVTPLAVGGAGVVLGLGAVWLISQQLDMSVFVLNIVTLLGLGIGIDYSLFFTSRFREELAGGGNVRDAIAATESSAGRAILFSGITSLIGLSSLLAFDLMAMRSIGIGALIVIASCVLASLTLLPAVLGILGHRVNRLPVLPGWSTRRSIWRPVSTWVMKRPLAVLLPTSALLILLALPVAGLRLGTVDASILPPDVKSRQAFDTLRRDFGLEFPAVIPVAYTFEGDPFEPARLEELYAYGRALEALPDVADVTSIVNLSPSYSAEQYKLMYRYPESVIDARAVRMLRDSVRQGAVMFTVQSGLHPFSPEAARLAANVKAVDPGPDRAVFVDGGPSEIRDLVNSLYSRFPFMIGAVVGVTYLSLLVLFRSVFLPLKAVLLNLLSILASYGVLVWVFQDGHLSSFLNFQSMGIIEASTPILLFAIVFGLSMDYEIFLLTRVSEAYRATRDNTESVALGLQRSGRIITGAAGILILVSGSFITADVLTIKAIGLGLAVAVFVDVTIVRALAAPAAMRLLGRWNWWLPAWLDRLIPGAGASE